MAASGHGACDYSCMPQLDQLSTELDRLAAFEAGPFPIVSLYLNLQADDRGRDRFEAFVRKELGERTETFEAGAPERESLRTDAARIEEYLGTIDRSANGLALFACSGAGLFEAFQLAAPIDAHRLYVSDRPHLYPLARLLDEYRRYLVLLADEHSARLFVFAANAVERTEGIENPKTKRHKVGGMAQARYQRHVDNYRLHHAKEIADTIARTVRAEAIDHVIISGDERIVPVIREHLPKDVAERIADILHLNVHASEREIVETTIAALRERDAQTDRDRVDALIGAYRANGLAVVGFERTRRALELGQVDELVISASPNQLREERAEDLIALARNTSAKIRFVENPDVLAPVGGAGAFLRFGL
jgi:peptide subunit release factor 1 (eRF1)